MFTLSRRENQHLLFIFLFALVLRLAYFIFLKHSYPFFDNPGSDVSYYDDWANEIASGHWIGDRVFYGLPLYPYFLASIKLLTLNHTFLLHLIHFILGSLNCVLTFLIARKIFSDSIAFLSAVLVSVNFTLIFYDWLMMPVTLLIFITLAIIWGILEAPKQISIKHYFLVGAMVGLAMLGDGKFIFFVPMIATYWIFITPKSSNILIPFFLGILLIICPVTIRNKIVGGDWVFISAQSGLSFYTGNTPQATGVYLSPTFIRPHHQGQDVDQQMMAKTLSQKDLTPSEVSQFWTKQSIEFIRTQPLQYLELLKKKFLLFFTETEEADDIAMILQRDWKFRWDINPFYILCPLAMIGIILSWRRYKEGRILTFIILSQLIFTVIFFLTTRHRASIIPLLIIFQSFSLCWLIEKIRQKNYRAPLIFLVAVIAYFIFFPRLELDKNSLNLIRYTNWAAFHERRGQYPEAQRLYEQALTIRTDDPNIYTNLGNILLLQKEYSKAEEYYHQALAIFPLHIDALFNLAFLYENIRQDEEAARIFHKLLEYEPKATDIHYHLAQIYQRSGECTKTQYHLQQILTVNPKLKNHLLEKFPACWK